jgi:exodeoxyribonuclease VII small subunit
LASTGKPAAPARADHPEEPFEETLDRLREIVEGLEQGEMSLEESLARFEEGIRLSRQAARRLEAAERRVEALLSEEGATRLVPFPEAEGDDIFGGGGRAGADE